MEERILDRLEQLKNLILSGISGKPYDLEGAATYLNISKSHLYQLTSKGLIGHYKPAGKKIYFEQTDLDGYLKRNHIAPVSEIVAGA